MDLQNVTKDNAHLIDEADVGSGEKTPGQRETEAIVEQIGTSLPDGAAPVTPAAPAPAGPDAGATGAPGAAELPLDQSPGVLPRAGAT